MNIQTTSMGMPVTVTIVDTTTRRQDIEAVFALFTAIDEVFSTYKPTSEISRINSGSLLLDEASEEVQHVLNLCEETKVVTHGYFDMYHNGKLDPSGIVKGYAIHEAAEFLRKKGYKNFFVEIAGDVEVAGFREGGMHWRVGIENPFDRSEIVKVIGITDKGVATSGTYIRGMHIYNPIDNILANDIASVTVIASNVYEADRFATAAFAMGEQGIVFLESMRDVEGYMITKEEKAVYTSGFEQFVLQ